jgi:NADPH-dependent 2,4-dienoyl-CoA reductase/sulfur reductase-like enzyme/nitrite reductase/ring-hydroxylating ferredoxin subunit
MHKIKAQSLKLLQQLTRSKALRSTVGSIGVKGGARAIMTASALLYGFSTLTSSNFVSMEEELNFVETISFDDLAEGQLREVPVGPDQKNDIVLLCKVDGQIYAVGPKCTHLGAPLLRGVIFGDRLYCPYHLASFSIKDGYHDMGPTYRALPTYKVEIRNGKIFVQVPKKLDNGGRDVPMSTRDPNNQEHYVLVGGGPASLAAAETLRQAGFKGKITMITKEAALPYDRTMLTKIPLKSDEKLEIRKKDFFDKYGIDVLNNAEVIKVDLENNQVALKDSSHIKYSKLLLAPGVRARTPQITGNDLKGIFTIRELSGIKNLQDYVKDNSPKNVIIVGGSFIGAEAASALKLDNPNLNITILNREKALYFRNLGETVGHMMDKFVTSNGVDVKNKTVVSQIKGHDGKINQVVLDDGSTLPADLLIFGTGTTFNTDFLTDDIKDPSGAISVDKHFRTKKDNVYAIGDAAILKDFGNVNVQHYSEAINQGAYAAWNMVGRNKPYVFAPFFWTRVFNKGLQFVGVPKEFDEIVLKGDLGKQEFVAVYCQKDDCHSASGMGATKEIITFNHALRLGLPLKKEHVKQENFFNDLEGEIRKKGHVCNCTRRKTNENKAE